MSTRTITMVLALLLTGALAYADTNFKEGGREIGQGVKEGGRRSVRGPRKSPSRPAR